MYCMVDYYSVYLMCIIDKYAGATNLINELTMSK